MLTFYFHFNLPLRLRARTDNSHSIRQTSPTSFTHSFIQPHSMTVSFLFFLLCFQPFLPISLWSKQVSFSLDVCVSVTFNCRLLSYTTPIERHPTMTIILCSDGCNLCLGTKEEHFWKPLSLLKWRAQLQDKVNRTISGFSIFLQVNSLDVGSRCGDCLFYLLRVMLWCISIF